MIKFVIIWLKKKKLKLYDTENIIKNKQQDKEEKISNKKEEKNNLPIEIKKENIIKRFLKFMRDIFNLRWDIWDSPNLSHFLSKNEI